MNVCLQDQHKVQGAWFDHLWGAALMLGTQHKILFIVHGVRLMQTKMNAVN